MLEAISAIGTLLLGIAGLYLTHNLRRHIRQRTADSRMSAYAELWEIMLLARPTRLHKLKGEELHGPLILDERTKLYQLLTEWYYKQGNGMFLGDNTRRLYLTAKTNLVCDDSELKPESLHTELKQQESKEEIQQLRGKWSIWQLSLLRTRMRADLEVYGPLFVGTLSDHDKQFLTYCGEDWRKKPWTPASAL